MDASKYTELRSKLQKRSDLDKANYDWFRAFLLSVVAQINQQHGPEAATCQFGLIEAGEFQPHKVMWLGSSFEFALEVRFNTPQGQRLFVHHIPFRAVVKDDILSIRCEESGETQSLSFDETRSEEGRKRVASMIDGPIENAVNASIKARESASLD